MISSEQLEPQQTSVETNKWLLLQVRSMSFCFTYGYFFFFLIPFPDGGEAEALSRMGPQLHAEDVPQVLLPVGLLVPEDTQADALGGQAQNANGLVVGRLPQVNAVHLCGTDERRT